MSTTREFTTEQLIEQCRGEIELAQITLRYGCSDTPHAVEKSLRLFEIALASLEAESKSYGPFTPKIIGAGVWTAITDELPAELEGRAVWLSTARQRR